MIVLRRFWQDERGAAAVEFSIISVVLVTLLIGIVDFGRTLYVKNQLSFLADQATRKVLIDPAITDTTLESELAADFTAGDSSDLTVTLSNDTANGNTYRLIDISYPMTLFIPNLTSQSINLSVVRRVPSG
jgi:Flp pilus assembly protein TadG